MKNAKQSLPVDNEVREQIDETVEDEATYDEEENQPGPSTDDPENEDVNQAPLHSVPTDTGPCTEADHGNEEVPTYVDELPLIQFMGSCV